MASTTGMGSPAISMTAASKTLDRSRDRLPR
jgi:hypothetical protein